MNKFQIAVAVPIKNYSFDYPNRFYGVVDSISGNTVTLESFSTESYSESNNLNLVLAPGDKVWFETSSGTTITSTVNTVSSQSFTILDTITGDVTTVQGYGSYMPGGWERDLLTYNQYTFDRPIGYFKGKCCAISNFVSTAQFGSFVLKQSFDTDYYISNIPYRVGCYYKRAVSDESSAYQRSIGLSMQLGYNSDNFSGNVVLLSDSVISSVDWTSGSVIQYCDVSNPDSFWLKTQIITSSGINITKSTLYIDYVFVEHVYDPILKKTIYDESPSSNAHTYYEIDAYPDLGSIRINERSKFSTEVMTDNSIRLKSFSGFGSLDDKYEISCRFTNVSVDVYKKLERLLRIQHNGYYLNFHSTLDNLPPVMTGVMELSEVSHDMWDLNLVSFNFTFKEA